MIRQGGLVGGMVLGGLLVLWMLKTIVAWKLAPSKRNGNGPPMGAVESRALHQATVEALRDLFREQRAHLDVLQRLAGALDKLDDALAKLSAMLDRGLERQQIMMRTVEKIEEESSKP